MITRDYCVMMARYNAWQNKQLAGYLNAFDSAELMLDRGAFFGSIQRTINHLVWGDQIWMSRFDGGAAPTGTAPGGLEMFATLTDWSAARTALDDRIETWANGLNDVELQQDMSWYSGIMEQEVSKPIAMLIVGMFNHQTHHRGQVHAMLTATGSDAPVTDLFFMPDDV